jgi:hypothetical protein
MRFAWLLSLPLLGLAAAPAPADDKPAGPALVLQLKPIDGLLADVSHVAKEVPEAGPAADPKARDALIAQQLGDDWRKAIDTTKPLGLFAVVEADVPQSWFAVLVPTGSPKDFVALLKKVRADVQEQGEAYKVTLPGVPLVLTLRFADGYAYLTEKESAKLFAPGEVFGKSDSVAALRLRVDRIPEPLRQTALGFIEGSLKNLKLEVADVNIPVVDYAKLLTADAKEVGLRLDFDRKTNELAVGFDLSARPGSDLAKKLAGYKSPSSRFAALATRDAAANVIVNLAAGPSGVGFDPDKAAEGITQELNKGGIAIKKEDVAPLAKALRAAMQVEQTDAAVSLRGPLEKERYALVAAAHIKDGPAVEKAFKQFVGGLPKDQQQYFKFDAGKVGGVNLHRVEFPADKMSAEARKAFEAFGSGPLVLAFREDALFAGFGAGAEKLLQEAAAARPQPAPQLQLDLSVSRVVPLNLQLIPDDLGREQMKKLEAAFKGQDRVRLFYATIDGGEKLQARVVTDLMAVLKFSQAARVEAKPTGFVPPKK